MKFDLPNSCKTFFSQNHLLELEELFSEQKANSLYEQIEKLLLRKSRGKAFSLKELWTLGRDLWKEEESIKKFLFTSKVGEIASFLFNRKPIRFVYTQVLTPCLKRDPFL